MIIDTTVVPPASPAHSASCGLCGKPGALSGGPLLAATPAPALWKTVRKAFAAALAVGLLLLVLAVWQGEAVVTLTHNGALRVLQIELKQPILLERSAGIIAWDLLLFSLLWVFFRLPQSGNRKIQTLAAAGLCLLLWRIVITNLALIAVPDWSALSLGPLPERTAVLPFLLILAIGKEGIFRHLQGGTGGPRHPLLEALSWLQRKDAIFNGLFALTVWAPALGISALSAHLAASFVKIFLMGSAGLKITASCLGILREGESRP